MKTYIVLFRGINVGGKNLLPMKELVCMLEKNNYQDVKTYIQSGNVILKCKSNPEKNIASLINDRYNFQPEVLAIEQSRFIKFVTNNPYKSDDGKTIHFYFCKDIPDVDLKKIEKIKSKTEKYHIDGKVLYLNAPNGIGRSKLVANIESCLGVCATGRNLNTVNKLESMLREYA